jgi:hypothetical protein
MEDQACPSAMSPIITASNTRNRQGYFSEENTTCFNSRQQTKTMDELLFRTIFIPMVSNPITSEGAASAPHLTTGVRRAFCPPPSLSTETPACPTIANTNSLTSPTSNNLSPSPPIAAPQSAADGVSLARGSATDPSHDSGGRPTPFEPEPLNCEPCASAAADPFHDDWPHW